MAKPQKKAKVDKDLSRIITPEFRLSYPHLFVAQAPKPTDKKKFSVTMLFPKLINGKPNPLMGSSPSGEPRSLKEAIRNAKLSFYGPKEDWPEDLESPVRDGDDPEFKDREGYKGHWVIKAISGEDQRPSVVARDMTPITEASEIYPGCYARAYIFAYRWEYMKKEGIGFILDHVQKLRDGKSFGGKKPVEQVFNSLPDLEDDETEEDTDQQEDF